MAALVVRSKVKSSMPKGMRVGGDFVKALDKKVAESLKDAAARAKANGRKTCRGYDL